jgi:hypothetical protein
LPNRAEKYVMFQRLTGIVIISPSAPALKPVK